MPAASLDFTLERHPHPVAASERAARLVDPGFGRVFTDHMVIVRYDEEQGWHDARIMPRGAIEMGPSSAVLHYAQEIFEGLKAYRLDDGGTALFRPEANARRFQHSARRLAMPELPEDIFLESLRRIVEIDHDWIPESEGGSLYLRPFMIASERFLGVKPAAEYLYIVIASSAGGYFKSGAAAISLWASEDYTRAAPGGTGSAKCGGNYAASLVAQGEAIRQGCDQVVFLDAIERRWIEELGGMNIMFVFADGSIRTPPLGDTILAGVTRDSLLALAREEGIVAEEKPYALDQWRADAESGRLVESFACGTAAVLTPIGRVLAKSGSFTIGDGEPGRMTMRLRERLESIQRGRSNDSHGWLQRLEMAMA